MNTNFEDYIGDISPPIQTSPYCQKSQVSFNFSSDVDNVDGFTYDLNEFGFRCGELKQSALLSVGCSICFGVGVAECDRTSALLAKEMGLDDINLSFPSKGIEYCYRILNWAVPKLKPKFVFLQSPQPHRREHLLPDSSTLDFIVNAKYFDSIYTSVYDSYINLMNDEQINLHYYNTVTSIEHLLERYGVDWIFLIPKKISNILSEILKNRDSRYIQLRGSIDLGRDNLHPGIHSHKLWAKALLLKIQDKDIPLEYFSGQQ